MTEASTSSLAPPSPTHAPTQSTSSDKETAPRFPREKLTALQRFMRLGKQKDKLVFPPPAWFNDSQPRNITGTAESPPVEPTASTSTPAALSSTIDRAGVAENDTKAGPSSAERQEETEPPPEPMTLAKRIQALLASAPTFTPPSTPPLSGPPSTSKQDDLSCAPPVPSAVRTPIDPKMLAFLSSVSVMNGSISKGRQSVWSALERLRSPSKRAADSGAGAGNKGKEPEQLEEEIDDDDNSSVMMYAPLEPGEDSEVEIARSDIMSVTDEGEYETAPDSGSAYDGLHEDRSPTPTQRYSTLAPMIQEPQQPPPPSASAEVSQQPKVKEVRVWFPSATKISLQATWWGYRLFLPPPVLDILSNKQLEATKRAALITASLKWFLDKLPVTVLPLQLRGFAVILKRLAPYLGYIGGFIAWSWQSIKSFDKGDGVILTATWLLPIALIPGTWDLNDFPIELPAEFIKK